MSDPTRDLQILGPMRPGYDEILFQEALAFVADLAETHGPRVKQLLAARAEAQARYDAGSPPDFLEATREIREGDWTVAPLPEDLQDRRVEITGPVERKMIINALNSGANECSWPTSRTRTRPTWANVVESASFTCATPSAVRSSSRTHPRASRLRAERRRPRRSWSARAAGTCEEKHVLVDGEPVPAALFDFGLYFFHNAREALLGAAAARTSTCRSCRVTSRRGCGTTCSSFAQDATGDSPRDSSAPRCSSRRSRPRSRWTRSSGSCASTRRGSTAGRWDYIFSFIKTFRSQRNGPRPARPRRRSTMTQPFMRAYTQLLIQHVPPSGVHAMGGMAAQIPIRKDRRGERRMALSSRSASGQEARVRATAHDGTWVAHPGSRARRHRCRSSTPTCPRPNQIEKHRATTSRSAADDLLLRLRTGKHHRGGAAAERLRRRCSISRRGCEGRAASRSINLMEDAATAEISRSQLWQWIHCTAQQSWTTAAPVTPELVPKGPHTKS